VPATVAGVDCGPTMVTKAGLAMQDGPCIKGTYLLPDLSVKVALEQRCTTFGTGLVFELVGRKQMFLFLTTYSIACKYPFSLLRYL